MNKAIDALSEDEFDSELEKLMNSPVDEDMDTDEVSDDEDGSQETEEEPQDEVVDEDDSEDTDEAEGDSATEDDSETETEDDETEDDDKDIEQPSDDEKDDETDEPSEQSKDTDSIEEAQKPFTFADIADDTVIPEDMKVNGAVVRATYGELKAGFKQGMNYTKKMQEMAPMRKSLNIMKENSISEEDLQILVDLKKGNTKAAARLLKDAGIESIDVDTDSDTEFVPGDHGEEPESFAMEQVKTTISNDAENFPKVQTALDEMQDDFFDEIAGSPDNLQNLYLDISSGVYDIVKPEMDKLSAVYGKVPSIELYKTATANVRKRYEAENPPKVEKKAKPIDTEALQQKRKAATSGTKRKAAPEKESLINFDDLSDDQFEKEFEKMTGRALREYE